MEMGNYRIPPTRIFQKGGSFVVFAMRAMRSAAKNSALHELVLYFTAFALGAMLASAQMTITAVSPPGTITTDIGNVVGWVRFIFFAIAVFLVVIGALALRKQHAEGWLELGGALVAILIAASANSIVTNIYHGGSG
jgi:hypothetical protein